MVFGAIGRLGRASCRRWVHAPLLLALLTIVVIPASAQAAFPGKNGRIAYTTKDPSGVGRIATVEPDGTFPSDLGVEGYEPAWSPDGTRLAFAGMGEGSYALVTSNAHGGDVRTVLPSLGTQFASSPSWSPDGAKLTFTEYTCWYECSGAIKIVNLDGSGETLLAYGEFPAWSPDGKKIAFQHVAEVRTINPDGTGHVNLTNSGPDDAHPNWSPDGKQIAFASSRDGNYEIYVMNANGSGQTRTTNRPDHDTSPAWSPDGRQIVFESTLDSDPMGCGSSCGGSIHAMNADGSGRRMVSPPGSNSGDPDWQPVVGHPRPRNADSATASLVPAFAECAVPNATHGAPLAEPSCSPITQLSDFLTVGTPDSNGSAANSRGFLGMRVRSCPLCASPLPPDVLLTSEITDVRNRASLTDYTGELEAVLQLRITDRQNGPSLDRAGTVTDVPLSFPLTCTSTEEAGTGGSCTASTSANAITPGIVKDFGRSVWQLGQVQVYDGGPDGDADTADNRLFAVQGLYAP